jgi:Flp pilus assembly protein TadB
MERLDKLIEAVAALLILVTALLVGAICGRAIAVASAAALWVMMIVWRKRNRRIERPR